MSAAAPGPRCALVVTLDRFPASILGCYGNEWIETPHVDRLAAQGQVADNCWTPRIGPASADDVFSAAQCTATLKSKSVRTLLFQEADAQVDFSSLKFSHRETVRGELGPTAKPDQIPLANLARRVQAAWAAEQSAGQSCLIWLHGAGLTIPAFPPAGFADLYQDEFEDREVNFDAMSEDERYHHPSTTAGMASLLDHWIGQAIAAIPGEPATPPTLIVFTSAQGIGWHPLPNSFRPLDELRSQAAHVPWIVQAKSANGDLRPFGLRTDRLCSTRQLGPLLDGWFRSADFAVEAHDKITTATPSGAMRITTSDWAAIFPATGMVSEAGSPADQSLTRASPDSTRPLLFSKPEDYWEVNNLADVAPEIVEGLLRGQPISSSFAASSASSS